MDATSPEPKNYYWTSSSGRLYLRLTEEQVSTGHHSGDCQADVEAIAQDESLAPQLTQWSPDDLRLELREYGAWSDEELADPKMNLTRMLWIACGDCADDPESYREEEACHG